MIPSIKPLSQDPFSIPYALRKWLLERLSYVCEIPENSRLMPFLDETIVAQMLDELLAEKGLQLSAEAYSHLVASSLDTLLFYREMLQNISDYEAKG